MCVRASIHTYNTYNGRVKYTDGQEYCAVRVVLGFGNSPLAVSRILSSVIVFFGPMTTDWNSNNRDDDRRVYIRIYSTRCNIIIPNTESPICAHEYCRAMDDICGKIEWAVVCFVYIYIYIRNFSIIFNVLYSCTTYRYYICNATGITT